MNSRHQTFGPDKLICENVRHKEKNTKIASRFTVISTSFFMIAMAIMDLGPVFAQEASSDWPGFLGANRDGRSSETGILKDWSDGKLKLAWKKTIGEGYGIGSVKANQMFQFDFINGNERLQCLDVNNGNQVWEFKHPSTYKDTFGFDSGPRASPIVDGDRVYCLGAEGKLFCVNTKDGKLIWKVDTQKEFGVVQNFFGVGSTPVVAGKNLLVMVGGSPEKDQKLAKGRMADVSPNGSAIVAFDKLTGKVVKKFGDDLASYSSIKLTEVSGKKVGYAWCRKGLVAFDVEKLEVNWTFDWRARKLESVNAVTPVVDGDLVFLSESYGPGSVVLRNLGDKYEEVWSDAKRRDKAFKIHWNTPVLHDGMLYASNGESRAELRCVEFKTGKVKWSQPGYARASLTFVDGHLIVLDEKGKLFLMKPDSEKFQIVTTYSDENDKPLKVTPPCWAGAIVASGKLFFRSKQHLFCFQLVEAK